MNAPDKKPAEMTDEELAVLIQRGDTEGLGILMERYEPKLHRYGRKFLANRENIKDVVQEVFIKVYENLQSFNPSKKFSSWIYRIAHNTFVNALRDSSKNVVSVFDFDTLIPHPIYDDSAIKDREQKEIREVLDRGIAYLPPMYREVIILYYFEELGYEEIADVLHIPMGTVGIRLKRAKKMLKQKLDAGLL